MGSMVQLVFVGLFLLAAIIAAIWLIWRAKARKVAQVDWQRTPLLVGGNHCMGLDVVRIVDNVWLANRSQEWLANLDKEYTLAITVIVDGVPRVDIPVELQKFGDQLFLVAVDDVVDPTASEDSPTT